MVWIFVAHVRERPLVRTREKSVALCPCTFLGYKDVRGQLTSLAVPFLAPSPAYAVWMPRSTAHLQLEVCPRLDCSVPCDHCPNYIFKLMEQGRRMFDVSIGSSSAQCPTSVVSNEAAKLIVNANLQHGCVFRNV